MDDLGVAHRVRHVRPQVRVRIAVLLREAEVELPVGFRHGQLTQFHDLRARLLVRLRQVDRRLLERQPVDEDHVRVRERLRVARRRLERM